MNDKEKPLIEPGKYGTLPRRLFLGDLVKYAKMLALGSFVYPSGLLLTSGCGNLSSETVAGTDADSLTVQINGADGTDQDGNPVIRANARDSLEIVATARGLSSSIGFFMAGKFGTFQGGTLGTDGYTYFTADEEGRARALLVSINDVAGTFAGRAEVFVKSNQKVVSKFITFEFATLTLFPSTLVFDGQNSTIATVVARGGFEPIEWFISNPRALSIRPSGDSVVVLIKDFAALVNAGSAGATLTAFDAEGQSATATIKSGLSTCTTAVLSVDPGVATSGTVTTVSVTLDDFDRAGQSSITVAITGEGVNATTTLTPWITSGLFQGTYTFTPPSPGTYTFSVGDKDASCQGAVATDTLVVT